MGRAAAHATFDVGGASVRLLRPLLAHLLSRGTDVASLLASEGVTPAGIFDSAARLPHETMAAIWTRAREITGDPYLGLRALDVADFRLVTVAGEPSEYVLLQLSAASATVGDAIERWTRYYGLAQLDARFATEVRPGDVRVTFDVVSGLARPGAYVEFCLGALIRLIRGAAARPVAPLRVFLRHAAPAQGDEHVRAFGAPVSFDESGTADGFEIARGHLDVPLTTSQPTLIAMLERRAAEALETIESRGVVAQVRNAIGAELVAGNPSAEQVAARLATPVRTLSRRLATAGTSYRNVLDGVRAPLARRYLVVEGRSVTETATLLGFADPSSFARAFKRWFGEGPSSAAAHAGHGGMAEKVGSPR